MRKILITRLPKPHGEIKGCWYNGYPIHSGESEASLNYATVYANEHNIVPDQAKLRENFRHFHDTLVEAGFEVIDLPFPEELKQPDCLHHDAVFIRDSGLMFGNFWIKANYSARSRQNESEIYAAMMARDFGKKVVQLPEDSHLEFGEVIYLETKNGNFYFGGLGRADRKGHDFVTSIVKPDRYCLIESEGYHLDTVFSPVLNDKNELAAFIVTRDMVPKKSIALLEKFNVEIIYVDNMDASGTDERLGNYAINTLIAPGIMINCSYFTTDGVEEKLKELGIKRYIVPLPYFRFAGGSIHCLTNDVYE